MRPFQASSRIDSQRHVQVGERSAYASVLEQAALGGGVDHVVEQLAQADLQHEAEAGALVHERRERHLPAVADAADDVLVGDPRALDEQLVELRLAGDLAQRADLHGLLLHVHQEVGEALVLGCVGVGARDEHAPLGVLGAAGPDLLARDDPLVAVLDGAGLQRREVRARLGLGESLAPDLLAGEDRREVALLLLVVAPDHQRRAAEQEAEDVRRQRHARAADLFEVDRRFGGRHAAAAELGGPARRGPAALV